MANTGNTQQQINYGAAANDGQGDPLRTAFIKTDDNFDAIWNAGPVGSNITILNNTVQSNNTNGNIVLRPNGVGVIQANASVVPNATNLRDLGSADLRFRAAYVGSGGLSVDGNVTVTGNLSAGNISYTGNVFVGDLQGSVYADDSTIMVDAVDNAMFADQATFGQANITGNVTANYFIGNGSLLTGVASSYGNANVADYLVSDFGTFGSNTVVTAGNIVASVLDVSAIQNQFPIGIQTNNGYVWQFAGNILRAPEGGTWQSAEGTEFIGSNTANGFINLVAYSAGNLATELFMEHGFVRIRVDNGGPEQDWNFRVTGTLDVPGDIIPQSNGTASLGNVTNQWANLWVANNTIYIGGVALGVTGNTLTVAGEPVLSNDSESNIATTGTITAGNIITNGISSDDSTFVTVQDGLNVAGDIESSGNVTANYFFGNGSQLTGLSTSSISNGTSNVEIATANGNVAINTNSNTWTFGTDGVLTTPSNILLNGDITSNTGTLTLQSANNGNAYVQLDDTGDSYLGAAANLSLLTDADNREWIFDTTGTLTTPGDITVGGDITGTAGANTLVVKAQPTTDTYIQLNSIVDSTVSIAANLDIVTDSSNTSQTWTFDTTGTLTAPGNITTTANITATGNVSAGNFIVSESLIGADASPQPTISGFSTISATGNITGANLITTGNVVGNVAGFAIGYRDIPQVAFTGNATIASADAGKHFYSTESTDYILTIADNSAVSWPVGTAITVVNRGTGNITVAQAAGVSLYLAGNSSAGNRTVTTYGMATLLNVAANVWMINGTGVI